MRCDLMERFCKQSSLNQCLAQICTGSFASFVRSALDSKRFSDKDKARSFGIGLPRIHPFAATPAVRTEKCDFLAGKGRFDRIVEGLKFGIFQFFGTHSRASKRKTGVIGQIALREIRNAENIGFPTGSLDTFGDILRHHFGVTRSAPVNDCNFIHYDSPI